MSNRPQYLEPDPWKPEWTRKSATVLKAVNHLTGKSVDDALKIFSSFDPTTIPTTVMVESLRRVFQAGDNKYPSLEEMTMAKDSFDASQVGHFNMDIRGTTEWTAWAQKENEQGDMARVSPGNTGPAGKLLTDFLAALSISPAVPPMPDPPKSTNLDEPKNDDDPVNEDDPMDVDDAPIVSTSDLTLSDPGKWLYDVLDEATAQMTPEEGLEHLSGLFARADGLGRLYATGREASGLARLSGEGMSVVSDGPHDDNDDDNDYDLAGDTLAFKVNS